MLRGVFVTGTDTGVGKTAVAAALMHRYRKSGTLKYWKPIQTGMEQDDDTATVRRYGACSDDEIFDEGIRLSPPVSPHLAAKMAGAHIDVDNVLSGADKAPASVRWVIEGAGGVLVPINETDLMIDLMVRLGMAVVVAARSSLGTINHTLLTIEALRRRNLEVAGTVMIGDPNTPNRDAIEHFGGVPVLGEMPHFPQMTAERLGQWASAQLDPQGRLARHFQP
jgi:dethiobiotin synthase